MLTHPPGYSILLAAINRLSFNEYEALWSIQIICEGLATLLVFLIASRLFGQRVGFIAGMLVALSPQLAYYSLFLTPDSLSVLPLLAAIYFIVLATKKPKLIYLISSGAFIGLSCWLRANAMILGLFLGLVVLVLFERGTRLRYGAALVGASLLVIAPLTIRNLVVFHRFIPISIEAGHNLAVGIADFDPEGKLGMPRSDREALVKDVEWSGRQDYGYTLWFPDGIERDQARLARGLAIIRSRPIWFLGVMLRRAAFMLRYNDSASYGWPLDSSVVGYVQAEPPFSHALLFDPGQEPDTAPPRILVLDGQVLKQPATFPEATTQWSAAPSDLAASGRPLSPGTAVAVTADGQMFAITGDRSDYGRQFASAPITVEPYTDYVLLIQVVAPRGSMAVQVLSRDMKIAIASASVSNAIREAGIGEIGASGVDGRISLERGPFEQRQVQFQIPFATGPRSELYIVFSNNGRTSEAPTLGIGDAKLITIGPTSGMLTRFPRIAIRSIQKRLFTTWHMLTFVLAGAALLALAGRFRTLLLLLAVPLYYMSAQSVLHTEYRYTLGIHYFAFILAGVALYCALALCYRAMRWSALALSDRLGLRQAGRES